ncbi:hypothetical protein GEMRC1_003909 [Eukaryota sp. GEM-RC1]
MANLKKVDLLVSLSSYGFLSVLFVIFVVGFKSINKGLNISSDLILARGPAVQNFAGLLMLAFFIHNLVITIKSNQLFPAKMTRNLGFAYIITAVSYLFVGSMGF